MGSPAADPAAFNDSLNLVGRKVGRYELLYEIASGGMAGVYLARHRGDAGFERIVAVKVPHPHLRHDEEFATMFLDEARLAAKIHHPNVVAVVDFGQANALYLVMEYIEGSHLAGMIRAAGKLSKRIPVPVTLRIICDSLNGLHAAHELKDTNGQALNIVHRDMSPQNVLVGVDGVSRITDFGIARAEARASVTRDGQVKGKLAYIAPEQLTGKSVNRRADLFGCGVLLWEALTGQRLFRADTEVETVNMLLNGEIRKPSLINPDVAPDIDAIVMKALERDLEKRFQTAADFSDAIENTGKVGPTRAVTASIEELLGANLEKRRSITREILESGRTFRSVPPLADGTGSYGAVTGIANTTPAGSIDVTRDAIPIQRQGDRRTRLVALIGVGVVLIAGLLFAALHRSSSAPVTAAHVGSQTPAAQHVEASPHPVPPALPPPVPPPEPTPQRATNSTDAGTAEPGVDGTGGARRNHSHAHHREYTPQAI